LKLLKNYATRTILVISNSEKLITYILKMIIFFTLLYFLSTYACESLFPITNLIELKERYALTNETIADCVSLKIIKYTSDIKTSTAKKQYITPNLRMFDKT
jgi:hypothetical protein